MFKLSTIIGRTGFEKEISQQLAKNVEVKYSANSAIYALAIGRVALNEIVRDIEIDEGVEVAFDLQDDDIYEIDTFIDGERVIVGWEIETYGSEI